MTSEGQELSGEGVIRLRTNEFELLRQVVREIRELSDDQLSALSVRRDEVDVLRTAVRSVHGELADTDYTALDVVLDRDSAGPPAVTRPEPATARVTGMLTQATAVRLPGMIHYVRDWLGGLELSHRTGSDPAQLDALADRFQSAGSSR